MVEVREITQGQTAQVAEALLVLRPRWKTADAVLNHMLSEVGDEGLRLSEVKTLDQAVDYAPYVATRAFWERQGFIQIDAIDPHARLATWEIPQRSTLPLSPGPDDRPIRCHPTPTSVEQPGLARSVSLRAGSFVRGRAGRTWCRLSMICPANVNRSTMAA